MASRKVPSASQGGTLPRLAVAADQNLVAESVRAALRYRGYDAVLVRWPVADEPSGAVVTHRRRRSGHAQRPPPDIAVLVSDLAKATQISGAQALVGGLDVPWLVLAGAPRGLAWGALYERGAAAIVSTDIGLDELCGFVDDLYCGRTKADSARRRDLIGAWRAYAERRSGLAARLDTLTAREEEVLELLYQGLAVRLIAERGEVTEATVRSQVKAILRKLEVNSQIAAVAAYEQVRAVSADRLLATAELVSGSHG